MSRGVPGGYPPEFRTLVEVAFRQERFIPCPDVNTAISMRHRLNNYRVWLRRNPEADPECLAMIEQVEFGLRPLRSDIKAHEQYGTPLPQPGIIAKPRSGDYATLISQALDTFEPAPEPSVTIDPQRMTTVQLSDEVPTFSLDPVHATAADESMAEALKAFMQHEEDEQ